MNKIIFHENDCVNVNLDCIPSPVIIDGVEVSPRSLKEGDLKSQPELFRYDMSEDIAAEIAQEEAFVRRLELGALMDDDNEGYRISWGAETHYDVLNSDETNYETL